jgi:hypothetical protein
MHTLHKQSYIAALCCGTTERIVSLAWTSEFGCAVVWKTRSNSTAKANMIDGTIFICLAICAAAEPGAR